MVHVIESIRTIAQSHFEGAQYSHDWEHTERVYRLCMHIGAAEGADLEVLAIAAYLHDIGRAHQDTSRGSVCHAEMGARIASVILERFPLPSDRRDNIVHCVLTHRYRNSHVPETLEAKCLFDADKLDAIGAVGIARAYLFAGEVGALLHNPDAVPEKTMPYSRDDTGYREYRVKLSRIRDRMLTAEGRRMARERHAFMEQFFERFLQEHEGLL
ncbi:MAG TPA: HD domain-containing protein [Deltaproteobacteria bacterium]|nr:HD domain-containing protein [Deltaproteobacteria bacterium]HQI82189.1 HD domain-containing protein [Deltaproteobacteria bacterium]